MKPSVLASLVVALVLGNSAAWAEGGHGGGYNGGGGHGGGYNGGGGHGGYNGGYGGHGGSNDWHGGGNYWHGGGNYWHGGGYRYPYYPAYYGYSHHNNNNNSNNGAAYALGGLVVGSLLTNAYLQNRVAQPVYVEQTYQAPTRVVVVQQGVQQGHRLLKDLNGNCYERTTDGAGNELRTELPPSECNW